MQILKESNIINYSVEINRAYFSCGCDIGCGCDYDFFGGDDCGCDD